MPEPVALLKLSASDSQAAIERSPELSDPYARDPRVLEILVRDEAEYLEVAELLRIAVPRLRSDRGRTGALIDVMLPGDSAVLGRGGIAQARRNAEFQTAIAEEFGLLTSLELAARAGSEARNTAATANRWRSALRIFAVQVRGQQVFPGFQFDDEGQPIAVLGKLLPILSTVLAGWELTSWFAAPRDVFDGQRVIDVWIDLPTEVIALAEQARQELEVEAAQ